MEREAMPGGEFLHVYILLVTKQFVLTDARGNNGQDLLVKFICDCVPIRMLHKRTKQPGAVDLRISIHAENADQLIVIVSQHESVRRWDKTLCQRGAHIRFVFAEEAGMMCPVTVEA